MSVRFSQGNLWLRLALIFGAWTLVAVLLTSQEMLVIEIAKETMPELAEKVSAFGAWLFLQTFLVECYVWALLSLAIIPLGRRFPFSPRSWVRSLLVHVPASVLFACLQTALAIPLQWLLNSDSSHPLTLRAVGLALLAKSHMNLLAYAVILGMGQAFLYYRKYRDRELRALHLETQLTQAQLQVLKMQLHPHFLFNTLNAISALVHEDADLADRMIARLGELLRSTLEMAHLHEVSLRQEVEFIRPYLEIEQARMGDRLLVNLEIDPGVLDARVPSLLLQPLVENAIRHGIAPRAEPGHIQVVARRESSCLLVEVSDDGPGLATAMKEGVGLANTRARLGQLYKGEHTFEMNNGVGRGLTVRVRIPYRESCVERAGGVAEAAGEAAHVDRR